MLGKVHGPYLRPDGIQHVVIALHNEDGSIAKKQTISYKKYLKELDEGLHNYEQYVKPIAKPKVIDIVRQELSKPREVQCTNCNKDIISHKIPGEFIGYFCSKSCREIYKRKLLKRIKPIYHQQIVIPINEKQEDKYFIIIENKPGDRTARFIPRDKCITEITDDSNGVPIIKLKYKLEDSVRVKPVKSYKKYFWITESGVLISRRSKKVLSQTLIATGYYTHATRIGGRKGDNKCFKIHRLVAEIFVPNPDNKPHVNHLDGIKTNNHYTNLEWCTNHENVLHAIDNGLRDSLYAENASFAKLTNEQANEIRSLHKTGQYTQKQLAIIYSISETSMSDLINYRTYKNI